MSGAGPAPDVHIDRLVLDIPGLEPAQARAIAHGVAAGLADAGVDAIGAAAERATVNVRLAGAVGPPADVAARIVAVLLERLA
jgi:hypothetical protein